LENTHTGRVGRRGIKGIHIPRVSRDIVDPVRKIEVAARNKRLQKKTAVAKGKKVTSY